MISGLKDAVRPIRVPSRSPLMTNLWVLTHSGTNGSARSSAQSRRRIRLILYPAPSTISPGNTTYYIDNVSGKDTADGKSFSTAWQSLRKVNQTIFSGGDSILFKSTGAWAGTLSPKGSGSAGNPVVISSYGGVVLLAALAGLAVVVIFGIHKLAGRRIRRGPAWDCGFPDPRPETQYSASSFAQPLRRVFGTTPGPVLEASPTSWEGQPVTADADAYSLAVSAFAQVRLAMRIAPNSGSVLSGRLLLNSLEPNFSLTAGVLTGAKLADGGPVAGGVGPPGVAASDEGGGEGSMRLGFLAAGQLHQIGVDNDWETIRASAFRSYGIRANDTLWAWGFNADGLLGDNSFKNRPAPVRILP